jgi:SAM-dependent methyltransferase
MPGYASFAAFYDAVQGERADDADFARSLVERGRPDARRVLELACGTGSVLARLRDGYEEVVGVDRSPEMLAVAAAKLPGVRLVEADMTTVRLGETFDAVLCLYDSVNHLLRWQEWEALFDTACAHLDPSGVFVFDVNTPRRLAWLADQPAIVRRFGGNLLLLDVVDAGGGVVDWELGVFEPVGDGTYRLHEETIPEIGFPAERIRAALEARFRRVRVADRQRSRPTARSGRLWFAARGPRPAADA